MIKMISNRDDFLMTVLECGRDDLSLLDDVNYDWGNILEDGLSDLRGINGVMYAVFEYGIARINDSISDRIADLSARGEELDIEEKKELEELQTLVPNEDIRSYRNCLDTSVWAENHGAVYRKYLSDALEDFRYGTGFSIDTGWSDDE